MNQEVLNATLCAYSRSIATNTLYILPEILNGLSSIVSIFVLLYSFFLYGFKMLFHHNAKILMILLTILCLLFSIDVTFVTTRQIFVAITYQNDCDLVLLTSFCTIFRRVALTCFVGVTTTQFFQMLERLIATIMKEKYEFHTQWLGSLFVLFSLLIAVLTIEWALWNENPNEPITHCLSYSASVSIGERIYNVFYGILVTDILILIAFFALYRNNRVKILSAGLSKKYQKHENVIVLRALFPMVMFNAVFVSFYILIAVIGREFRSYMTLTEYKLFAINTFIFPYVSFFLSVTIFFTTRGEHLRRIQKSQDDAKQNTQTYFSMYESQWSTTNRDEKVFMHCS